MGGIPHSSLAAGVFVVIYPVLTPGMESAEMTGIGNPNHQARNGIGILLVALLLSTGCGMASALGGRTAYNSNPNHLWNRLNETLFLRTAPDGTQYGLDEMDILYWGQTTNLLAGTSHQRALAVLDEFINTHGEKLVPDPLKMALLQRDLWALFDWVTPAFSFSRAKFAKERLELAERLAIVIRRLELTTNEIAALPDNYAESHLPDLPRGMFQTNGDWINVQANNVESLVPMHDRGFGGRSVFMVLFHDADGRKAGTNYLARLSTFRPLWVPATHSNFPNEITLNPDLPQFPTNSQWALARRMCVIDTNGNIQPTRIVESIQLRTYLHFDRFFPHDLDANPPQHFNEFRMSRDSHASLVSVAQNGKDFTSNNHFFSFGIDPFESRLRGETNVVSDFRGIVLRSCYQCHGGPGISSVNSFTRALSGALPAEATQMTEADLQREEEMSVFWKERDFEWGFLQGLWNQQN
ncbi:MAG TPA: hypothetical protein VMJ12_00580 [Candidatus Acidoferrales bacterium]|nr:hypothetical protein [Candidatus Acidoferrales bacterium]